MDLVSYIGCLVYITLNDSFYYTGLVLNADDNSITIKDKVGKKVTLSVNSILTIREVQENG